MVVIAKPLQTKACASCLATAPAVKVYKPRTHAANAAVGPQARPPSSVLTLRSLLVAPVASAFASAGTLRAFAIKTATEAASLVMVTSSKQVMVHTLNVEPRTGLELVLSEGMPPDTFSVNADVLTTMCATLGPHYILAVLGTMARQS
mmetsp:Transcript_16521/g.38112  ORF Transcript_16521/g.38112 Transcript_16521/m.38112 type:complete len:148 (+) Transcript_16521:794-1237(+)